MERYQRELAYITRAIRARNTATSILYENLIPSWIPNSQFLFFIFPYCLEVSAVSVSQGSIQQNLRYPDIVCYTFCLCFLPINLDIEVC